MPLLTYNEFENISPLFRGGLGNAFVKTLMHLLSVDKVNELYDRNAFYEGPDFATHVLEDIGVRYQVQGNVPLKSLPEGPFVTISNHPYGSIDGIILVDMLGHLRPDYKVMANNFLSRIKPLESSFICVTPTGNERTAPTSASLKGIKDALEHVKEGHPLGIFPSGAVSDLSLKDRCVRDREWQEPVLRLIKKLRVPIVPVSFLGRNSVLYYSLGLLDWRIRLLRLPAEVFNKEGKQVRVRIGNVITPQMQDKYQDLKEYGCFLRNSIYKY